MNPQTFLLRAMGCAALAALLPAHALAQKPSPDTYPSKPVTLVLPHVAGGTSDNEMRLYTGKLQQAMGQPFINDFRVGAATTIASAYVARSAPDGYTLLVNNSGLTITPSFFPDLPYDVNKAFVPVIIMSDRSTAILASPVSLPNVNNLNDLVAWGKANPDKLNCGTSGGGAGSLTHIVCVALSSASRTPFTYIHYKGAAQSSIDLIAGRTHIGAGTIFTAQSNIRAGKMRILAITNERRSSLFPDIRTAKEQGYDVLYPSWLGTFAPAGVPAAIVARLSAEMTKAVMAPDTVKQLESQGATAVAEPPAEARKRISSELVRWKKLITEENIKLEE